MKKSITIKERSLIGYRIYCKKNIWLQKDSKQPKIGPNKNFRIINSGTNLFREHQNWSQLLHRRFHHILPRHQRRQDLEALLMTFLYQNLFDFRTYLLLLKFLPWNLSTSVGSKIICKKTSSRNNRFLRHKFWNLPFLDDISIDYRLYKWSQVFHGFQSSDEKSESISFVEKNRLSLSQTYKAVMYPKYYLDDFYFGWLKK